MEQEKNTEEFKIIETTKGDILSPYSNNSQFRQKILLFNQILSPQPVKDRCGLTVDLQNLTYHKQYPNSLENTSLSWSSIEHQVRQIVKKPQNPQDQILLFDGSQYQKKIPQIFQSYSIVKGYNYRPLTSQRVTQQEAALLQSSHVFKQIEMEFNLGNGKFKPGYIGQISIKEIQKPQFQGVIKAYMKYSNLTGCPIVINAQTTNYEPYIHIFQQNLSQVEKRVEKDFKIIEELLKKNQNLQVIKNITLFNLPLVFIYDRNGCIASKSFYYQKITSLIKHFNVSIAFNVLRYGSRLQKIGLIQIARIARQFPKNLILTSNLQFKTDLQVYGGQGLSFYRQNDNELATDIRISNTNQFLKMILQECIWQQITSENILKLMDWKIKKKEIKVQVYWKCDKCLEDFPQSRKAFGKFEKQFCSIKCLKGFKF